MIAFFNEFERKVERLPKMCANSFADEAFTLCVVYTDRLTSGYYGGGAGKNQENFCRGLREISGDPLFVMLHPGRLLEQAQQHFRDAATVISSTTASQPHALLNEADVAVAIRASALEDSKKQKLIHNLWRASIACICYERIRCPEIHGGGSGGLDFDDTVYQGKVGLQVDFGLIYGALSRIFEHVRNASVQSGHWFGNPNYLRRCL